MMIILKRHQKMNTCRKDGFKISVKPMVDRFPACNEIKLYFTAIIECSLLYDVHIMHDVMGIDIYRIVYTVYNGAGIKVQIGLWLDIYTWS